MLSSMTKNLMNKAANFKDDSKDESKCESKYESKCESKKDKSKGDSVEKLICDFNDKNNYGIHYRTLKLYISLGLKLKKVHSCILFNQSAWLKNTLILIQKNVPVQKMILRRIFQINEQCCIWKNYGECT